MDFCHYDIDFLICYVKRLQQKLQKYRLPTGNIQLVDLECGVIIEKCQMKSAVVYFSRYHDVKSLYSEDLKKVLNDIGVDFFDQYLVSVGSLPNFFSIGQLEFIKEEVCF